jgi:hypothetical protein
MSHDRVKAFIRGTNAEGLLLSIYTCGHGEVRTKLSRDVELLRQRDTLYTTNSLYTSIESDPIPHDGLDWCLRKRTSACKPSKSKDVSR